MSGLEQMIQLILKDAGEESERILSIAEEERKQIEAEAKKEGEIRKVQMLFKAEENLNREKQKSRAGAERLYKRQVLQLKQKIIEEIFDGAREKFIKLPVQQYCHWMEEELNGLLHTGEGILYCMERDIDRMPQAFQKKLQSMAAAKGGCLKIQEAPWPIERGFVLAYGEILENHTLPALLENRREELQDLLNQYLFAEVPKS